MIIRCSSGSDFGWQHLHQGGRRDPITGLYHFRYRDYSAALGRWINPDPAGYIDGASSGLVFGRVRTSVAGWPAT